jgi:Ca-activated chloride channel family protein
MRMPPALTAISVAWILSSATIAAFEQLTALGVMGAADASLPTVRLVNPVDGRFVTGPTLLQAHVEPANEATAAVFFVNGRELCRRPAPPFECEWDAGTALASHQVRLVVNLRRGGRVVRTIRTAAPSFAEVVDVDAVQVTVTVVDNHGRYVKGLPRSAFRVFEDGKPQTISQFYGDDAPLELVVAADLSSSMTTALPEMKRALMTLLGAVAPQHRLTLLGFNDTVFPLLAPTDTVRTRYHAVQSVSAWGRTALYEAVIESVNVAGGRPGRKAVLVFTDGEDQGSRVTLADVEETLDSGDLILYMVAQGQGVRRDPLRQVMTKLAEPTGGRAILSNSHAALQRAFTGLIEEMSHQYVLGYQPADSDDDKRWRAISVDVVGDYRVRARQGYRKTAR